MTRHHISRNTATSLSAFIRMMTASLLATTMLAFASANDKSDRNDNGGKLIVNVEDLQGRADFNNDFAREDLLRNAFYRAAEKNDWLGDYKFQYNQNASDEDNGRLELNVVEWERSPAGEYRCSVTANYRSLDGKTIKLGVFHGSESSIDVTNRNDVAEHFVDAAKEAFASALEELRKKTDVG